MARIVSDFGENLISEVDQTYYTFEGTRVREKYKLLKYDIPVNHDLIVRARERRHERQCEASEFEQVEMTQSSVGTTSIGAGMGAFTPPSPLL